MRCRTTKIIPGPTKNFPWHFVNWLLAMLSPSQNPPNLKISIAFLCHVSYIVHMNTFGQHLRDRREMLRKEDKKFSVRQVAVRIGVEPAYLSKIERDKTAPPSENTIRKIAHELGENPDLLLAMAGKISTDLKDIILQRPKLFSSLLRELKEAPDNAILKVVREVNDGEW